MSPKSVGLFALSVVIAGTGVSVSAQSTPGTGHDAHAMRMEKANDALQQQLDKKYGVAPAGKWWDQMGRLCRTDHDGGKSVRRCEKPDAQALNNPDQQRLDKKYGVAPAGKWWDENGKLCRTDKVAGKSVRRCEDTTIRP